MAWSVPDLSIITQLLIDKLNDAVGALNPTPSGFTGVTGFMPAVSRTGGNTAMNIYLLHVSRDPFFRNTPVQGSIAQPNKSQPLSLNLYYLLTTYCETSWAVEQLLMSVAFEYFHANPIYKTSTAEFTITVEADTIDEMSRLWQAITVPIRLSALFRVAVVFLAPAQPSVADARLPVEVNLSVAPDLNMPAPSPLPEPQLYELAAQIEYRVPPAPKPDPANPGVIPPRIPPTIINTAPVVMGGQTLRVRGSGLNQPNAAAVYISSGASEWPLNFTRLYGTSASGTAGDADELVLEIPTAYGILPGAGTAIASTPLPGVFHFTVGAAATPGFRSNALTIIFAPAVANIGFGDPVITPDAGGVYTLTASGLVAGRNIHIPRDHLARHRGRCRAWRSHHRLPHQRNHLHATRAYALGSQHVPAYPCRRHLRSDEIEAPPGWWVHIP